MWIRSANAAAQMERPTPSAAEKSHRADVVHRVGTPTDDATRLARAWSMAGLACIIAIGSFLRLYQIGSKGLWLDEAFSIWISGHPMSEICPWLIRIDQHPPLYYLLLHGWMYMGNAAAVVRSFSAFASILNIPVIYLIGQRLADRWLGLLAALLLALSPFHIRFAQEARMYALLSLNASLSILALATLLADPHAAHSSTNRQFIQPLDKRKRVPPVLSPRPIRTGLAWAVYVLSTAAALLTHNTAILLWAAANLCVAALLWMRSLSAPSVRNWIGAQLGVLLLWSPWIRPFAIQAQGVYREFWIPKPTWLTVLQAIQNLLNYIPPGWNASSWMIPIIWACLGPLIVLGVLYWRRRPAILAVIGILWIAPLVGELLVSLRRPIFYDRTLIWTSIPLYLLVAAGTRRLRRPWGIAVAIFVVAAINLLSVHGYWLYLQKEQWDQAAMYVAGRAVPGDLLLFNATWVQIPFDYYFGDHPGVQEHGVPADLFDRSILEPKMTADDLPRLHALIQGRRRIWLIYSHDWYTDPQHLIPAALGQTLDLVAEKRFYGLQVYLYSLRSVQLDEQR